MSTEADDVDRRRRFVATTAVLIVLGIAVAALITPPDPFTLVYYAVPLVLAAPIVAYALTAVLEWP